MPLSDTIIYPAQDGPSCQCSTSHPERVPIVPWRIKIGSATELICDLT